MNRFVKPKRYFLCATGSSVLLGMAGSLAKRFPAKPALSVGLSPCDTFTFARQIYQTERKLRAKCVFFLCIFVKPLRELRKIPNQEIARKKKKRDSHYLQCGSATVSWMDHYLIILTSIAFFGKTLSKGAIVMSRAAPSGPRSPN